MALTIANPNFRNALSITALEFIAWTFAKLAICFVFMIWTVLKENNGISTIIFVSFIWESFFVSFFTWTPSHRFELSIQNAVRLTAELHLNCFSKQTNRSQSSPSSELSPQSSLPLQICTGLMQLPFLHWNWPCSHLKSRHVCGSSELSPQSSCTERKIHKLPLKRLQLRCISSLKWQTEHKR